MLQKIFFTSPAFILVLMVQIQFCSGATISYSKEKKIKCQSTTGIGNYGKIKCALMCKQYRAMTGLSCMAFNVSNSVCTLCINGPVSETKQVIWSSTEEVYAVTVKNYAEELGKGQIFFVTVIRFQQFQ